MLAELGISEEDWSATPQSVRTALFVLWQQNLLLQKQCALYDVRLRELQSQVTELESLRAEVAELRERLVPSQAGWFAGADPHTSYYGPPLRLASTDPTASPLIDFQYLAEPADLEVLAEGSEMVREIMAGAAFGGSVKEEIHPGAGLRGQELRDAILNRATSVYHGVGTCRMGVDELAVVTPELKVRGVDGLRVADASIMPSITGGNTNAPAIMIGERASDLILGRPAGGR